MNKKATAIALMVTGLIVLIAFGFMNASQGSVVKDDLVTYRVNYLCDENQRTFSSKNPECFEYFADYEGKSFKLKEGEITNLDQFIGIMADSLSADYSTKSQSVSQSIKTSYILLDNDVVDVTTNADNEPKLNSEEEFEVTLNNKFHDALQGTLIITEKKLDLVRVSYEVVDFTLPRGKTDFSFPIDTTEVGDIQYIASYEFDFFGRTEQGKDIVAENIAVGKDLIGDRFPEPIVDKRVNYLNITIITSAIIALIAGGILWLTRKKK